MIISSRAFWVGFYFLISDLLWPSWSSNVESSLVNDKQWMSSLSNKEGTFTADFEEENGTTIAVRDGTKAILNCRVYLRHDKTVSWLRHQENTIELLTVGDTTYSGDSRINISYQYPNNWRLNISDVQKVDAGLYVCQISSFPPKALFTNLQVQDALVEVIDSDGRPMKTQYYNPGSEIELTCVVRSRANWSTSVEWLKDGQVLDLNHRPSVSIGTQVEAKHVLSRLWIGGASASDTGNYTCTLPKYSPDAFPRARVKVHVVDGDFHAAVYGQGSSISRWSNILWDDLMMIPLLLIWR